MKRGDRIDPIEPRIRKHRNRDLLTQLFRSDDVRARHPTVHRSRLAQFYTFVKLEELVSRSTTVALDAYDSDWIASKVPHVQRADGAIAG